jgi:hypothetical protein
MTAVRIFEPTKCASCRSGDRLLARLDLKGDREGGGSCSIRDLLHRRLQPFCRLHDCSGCFRLERSPGGICTHWKAPSSQGARPKRTLIGASRTRRQLKKPLGTPTRTAAGLPFHK